jgi:hypothetical protein
MLRLAGAHPPPHARISALRPRFGSPVGSSHPGTPGASWPRPSSKLLTATRASAHPARKQPPGRGDRRRSLQLQRRTSSTSRMSVSPTPLQVPIALRVSGPSSANAQTAARSQVGACRLAVARQSRRTPTNSYESAARGAATYGSSRPSKADFGLEIVIARVGQSGQSRLLCGQTSHLPAVLGTPTAAAFAPTNSHRHHARYPCGSESKSWAVRWRAPPIRHERARRALRSPRPIVAQGAS